MSSGAQQYVTVFGKRKSKIWKALGARDFLLDARLHGFPPRPIPDLDEDQWERYGNIHYARRNKAYLYRTVDEDELYYARRLA